MYDSFLNDCQDMINCIYMIPMVSPDFYLFLF